MAAAVAAVTATPDATAAAVDLMVMIWTIDINQSVSFDLTSTVSKQTTKQFYHFHFFAYCWILIRMGDQSDAGLRLILSLSLFYASFIVFSPFYYNIDDDDI